MFGGRARIYRVIISTIRLKNIKIVNENHNNLQS